MEIEKAEAELLLKRARADRDQATVEIARLEMLQAQATGLNKLIEGLELMYPSLAEVPAVAAEATDAGPVPTTPPMSAAPPATDVVRTVLRENMDSWFTGRDMIVEFERRGIAATQTAIRLALKRAAEKGFAERSFSPDRGHIFRLSRETAPAQAEVPTS